MKFFEGFRKPRSGKNTLDKSGRTLDNTLRAAAIAGALGSTAALSPEDARIPEQDADRTISLQHNYANQSYLTDFDCVMFKDLLARRFEKENLA